MSKRRKAFIAQRRLAKKSPCPNCTKLLDGVTGIALDKPDRPVESLSGNSMHNLQGGMTMCLYCGAMLIFADSQGTLRLITADERARVERLDPVYKKLFADWRRDKVPNFAKKQYGGTN